MSFWAQSAVFGGATSIISIDDVEELLQHFNQLINPIADLLGVTPDAILNEEANGFEQGQLQGVVAYWAVVALKDLIDFDLSGNLDTNYPIDEVLATINNMIQLLEEVATILWDGRLRSFKKF